jgi:hypothetical protein
MLCRSRRPREETDEPISAQSTWHCVAKDQADDGAAPCEVIGYRSGKSGLRDLLLAAMVKGKPAYVGTVELGIRGGEDLLKRLQSLRTAKPAVACSLPARWVAPD